MRTILKQAAIGVGLLLLGAGPASAITLSLLPAVNPAENGDVVSLDLVVSGLTAGGPDSLGDFDIDIAYDPLVLSVLGYSLGPGLGDIGLGEALDFSFGDDGFGTVNLSEVSLLEADLATCIICLGPYLDDIQPDTFSLATIDFSVDALPDGDFTIVSIGTVWAVGDGFGLALPVTGLTDAEIFNPVSGVPEPASALLAGLGLLAAAGLRRRRRAT